MQNEVEVRVSLEPKINILSLSDEVLVHLCSFLTSVDVVSLSSSCSRFNGILCERKLVRCVNLRAAYYLTPVDLRSFFLPVVRCKNVDSVTLASCYWLTSSDLLWVILRLANLRCLHISDTNLSIEHLTRVLKNIKSIESLSWTFYMTRKTGSESIKALSEHLQNLKSFNLWTKGFAVCFLPMLLKNCSSLEVLKLSTYKFRDVPWDRTKLLNASEKLDLPNLKSFILNVCENYNNSLLDFLEKLFEVCNYNHQWNSLWLDTRFEIAQRILQCEEFSRHLKNLRDINALSLTISQECFFPILESKALRFFKCGNNNWENNVDQFRNSNITHLLWKHHGFPMSLPSGLQQLWISCNRMRKIIPKSSFISCDVLPHLTRLSVPVCSVLPHNSDYSTISIPQDKGTFQKKSERKSHFGKSVHTDCFLKLLTKVAPSIQELEMKCKEGCNTITQDEFPSLVLISQWSQLESLFLENLPNFDLSVLVMVSSSCPKIRRLGLKHVGITAGFSQTWNLVQAINLLENLEDFQFVHPVVDKLASIVDALSKRPKLRRISIICERTTVAQNLFSYLNLIEKCVDLVFLFARVASISQKMERDFQRELKAKFLNERKSLWALLQGIERDDFWECIPSVHCYEMIVDPALLTIIPPI